MTSGPHILGVGGAGYIGSHTVRHLLNAGCTVTPLDGLSTGRHDAVPGGEFVLEDRANTQALDDLSAPISSMP